MQKEKKYLDTLCQKVIETIIQNNKAILHDCYDKST